jgi:cytochrome P450
LSPNQGIVAGLHACPGIHLAFLSLRISIAAIVQNFDIIFAPGETGEVFDKECLDTFVIKLPPLRLSFVPRS